MHTGAMRRPLRVLCTSTGGAGHVHALAPVARALRDRGHDVRWAVAADGGGAVGAMGFEWSAAGLTTSARRDAAAAGAGRAHAAADGRTPRAAVRRAVRSGGRPGDATRTWRRSSIGSDPTWCCARRRSWPPHRWLPLAASRSSRWPSAVCCPNAPAARWSTRCDRCGRPRGSATRRGPTSTDSCTSIRSPSRSASAPIRPSCVRSVPIEGRRARRRPPGWRRSASTDPSCT